MIRPVKTSLMVAAMTLLWFSRNVANAQDQGDKPVPPFVAPIPDFFQWTVSIEAKPGSPNLTPSPSTTLNSGRQPSEPGQLTELVIQKVVCVKTKEICRNTIFYTDGTGFEVWYYDKKLIVKSPGGAVIIYPTGTLAAATLVPDVSSDGFVGVDWINVGNFQMKAKLANGREAFIYRGNAKPKSLTAQKEASSPVEASIDAETGFPLLVKQEKRTLLYSYQPPPAQMLTLPPEAQKELDAIKAKQSMIEKLRALPQH